MTAKELKVLLSLSQEISNAWNDKTLFKIIFERLKPILHFDEAAINIWEGNSIAFKLVTSEPWANALGQEQCELHPQFQRTLQNTHLEKLKELKKYGFFKIQEWVKDYPKSTELKLIHNLGYQDSLALPLWKNDTVIGTVEFLSAKKDAFRDINIELFSAAADQLSLATLKILSNLEITKQKSEKRLLLDIAEHIPSITSGETLIKLIDEKIRPMFRLSDVGIFLITEDKRYHWNFLNNPKGLNFLKEYAELNEEQDLFNHAKSPVEWLVAQSKEKDHPLIFDFDQLTKAFPQDQTFSDSSGSYASSFSALLRLKNEIVGIFCVCSLEPGLFQKRELSFFQAVTDQISLGLQNVLINEQVNQRQLEKEVLLGISEDISRSRTMKQLFKTVSDKIKPLFNFHDMGLFVLSEDQKYHQDLAIDAPEVHSSEWNISLADKFTGQTDHKGSPVEYIIQKVVEAGTVTLFDNEVLYRKFPRYTQFQSSAFRNSTYRDCLATILQVGTEVIGMFCINSLKKDFFKKEQYSLFQSIADQLAVAVSNILANEEILRSEKEKSLKLAITDIFADECSWEDKFGRLPSLLEPHLPFKILSFSLLTDDSRDDRSYRFENTTNGHEIIRDKAFYKKAKVKKARFLSHRRDLIKRKSSWFNKEDLKKLQGESPFTKQVREAYGINSMLFENIPLGAGNRLILMALDTGNNTYKQKHVDLFKKLTSSFSLSIEKLLAYEEIVRHKQEKEELLKLSEKLAAIRNRKELLNIISGPLKDLFQYDDVAISINSEDLRSHWLMVSDVMTETGIQERFATHLTNIIPNDNAYQRVISASNPFIFTYQDLVELELPMEDLKMLKTAKLNYAAGVALRQGGKNLGGLFMVAREAVFSTRSFNLYKNTADQIAIAVSNILNNEEILKRKEEKEVMLRISEQINQSRTRDDIMQLMARELKDLFGFEFTSLVFYNDGEKNYLPWIVNPSPELENHKVFEKFQQVPQPLNASFFQELMHAQEIKSFNTDEIIQKYPEYPGIALYQKNDIKSVIIVPLSYAKNTLGLWLFNSKDPHLLDKLNLTLLENTASQLAIAVSSLLAREEIIRLNQQLNQEKQYLEEEININYNFGELVGESDEIKKVFKKIDQVSNTGTTVLITGETGTGKEVIARAIHNSSDRRNKPLVKLNCAALPPQLMESELFGHEKGSFTGATGRRVGKFELANKGTIFLDEIGEMPLELQAKLLRVLQEKEVERIGGNTVIKVDVRIITATNRNLEEEIAHNRFRSDLFYRLNVFPISIPPLRERKNDILPLVNHFIKIKSKRIGKNIGNIGSESLKQLSNYSWPGNIRELEHVIERGLILSKGNTLKISLGEETTFGIMNESNGNGSDFKQIAPFKIRTIADAERELIVNTLEYTEGRVRGDGGAAQLLGIKPTTLEARMKKLGIKKNISYQKLEN